MDRTKLTAEEIQKISNHMKTVMQMGGEEREKFIAQTIGDVYDVEMPIPEVISSIARYVRAGNRPDDNHVYYLVPTTVDKDVYTLDSNCNVTQVKVTPNSRQELTIAPLASPDFWVCLHDFLSGDHDALAFYAEAGSEAMDRYETKLVLDILDAAAVANGNVFTRSSGAEGFDFPVLVAMARSIARYGKNLVLITGGNVTTDAILMDYRANTFREYGLDRLNIKHLAIENLTVDINQSGAESVMDPDVAYLVAVSDSKGNRPILVARRALSPVLDMPGVTTIKKDRIVVDTGVIKNVGAAVKWARGKAIYEEFGAVLLNGRTVAKFVNE